MCTQNWENTSRWFIRSLKVSLVHHHFTAWEDSPLILHLGKTTVLNSRTPLLRVSPAYWSRNLLFNRVLFERCIDVMVFLQTVLIFLCSQIKIHILIFEKKYILLLMKQRHQCAVLGRRKCKGRKVTWTDKNFFVLTLIDLNLHWRLLVWESEVLL